MVHNESAVLCEACNRPTRQDEVYVTLWLGSELNVVEGVPAHVCDHCGEQYYDADVEEKLRALSLAGFPRHLVVNTIAVPVFSLDNLGDVQTAFPQRKSA